MRIGDYMQNCFGYFWNWEEDGQVVAINGGATICYRGHLMTILEHLSRQGLPPFGSLLLALIATNPNGKNDIRFIRDDAFDGVWDPKDADILNDAYDFLEMLSESAARYKTGTNRLLLLQALFENCHNRTGVQLSMQLAANYGMQVFDDNHTSRRTPQQLFRHDFRTIALLCKQFPTVGSILERMAELPPIDEEIVLEFPEQAEHAPSETPKDFVDELIENAATFHTGSLIRRIWSGLNIPVHSVLPSEQPIGGVSDLTNKGNFDQLLVSEFAYDDLLFLSRIANNEALYIRREVPPENNNLERVILIDVSLKNWGTPRTIAYATALAIAHHPKTDIHCSVYAVGATFRPVGTATADEIIAGLQHLYPGLDAAAGIDGFFAEFPQQRSREVILILSQDARKSPQLQKTLADHQGKIDYWIYTDPEGGIDVYKKQQRSRRHLQHLLLPLNELWHKAPKEKQQEGKLRPHNDYPLLFRHVTTKSKLLPVNDSELFIVTRENRLFRFCDTRNYRVSLELIREDLPALSGEWAMGLFADGTYMLLRFNPQNREITLFDLTKDASKQVHFPQWKSHEDDSFLFHDDQFIHRNNNGFWTIDRDGTVTRSTVDFKELFERKKELRSTTSYVSSRTGNVLRNIREIYISSEDRLVFNIHELLFHEHRVQLHNRNNLTPKSIAIRATLDKDVYHFRDGSTITVNRSGMFILKSSNPELPVIYIPAVLDENIGLSTDAVFAGQETYRKQAFTAIVLHDAGPQKLQVVNLLKSLLYRSLEQCKLLTDNCPALIHNVPAGTDSDLVERLRELGAVASAEPMKMQYREQEVIETLAFEERYIQPFIRHILDHGTDH